MMLTLIHSLRVRAYMQGTVRWKGGEDLEAENLRLKIENQKLVDQNNQQKSVNSEQNLEIQTLNQKISAHDTTIISYTTRIENLNIELKTTGEARIVLKNDNDFLHAKVLTLEEQLQETKQELHVTKQELEEANQVAVDLLEQIRDLES